MTTNAITTLNRGTNAPTLGNVLRLLLWLKWVLTWRGLRRSRMRLVSSIVLVILFGPLSVAFAWGVHSLFAIVSAPDAALITRDVLAVLYIVWVVTPLFGFQLNESFDLTKLFTYPVNLATLFAGSVLGGLLDLPVLFTIPTFVVIIAYYTHGVLSCLCVIIALALFVLHTLALGQAVILAQVGFLQSRKYRDISVVVFPTIGMAYTVIQQFIVRQFSHGPNIQFFSTPIWKAADWLAPGYCIGVLDGLRTGSASHIATGALSLILACMVSGGLAVWSLRNLYFGDVASRSAEVIDNKPVRSGLTDPGLLRFLKPDIAAMTAKELCYIEREPQYKMLVIQLLCLLAVVAIPFLTAYSPAGLRIAISQHNAATFYSLSSLLMFWMMPLIFNHYAGEGAAITVLFALPTRRRAMILGKNIAHFIMMVVLNWAGLAGLAMVTGLWSAFPVSALLVLGCGPVLLAIGNLVSIYLPHRMFSRGNRPQPGGLSAADGTGCAYAALYMLAYIGAIIVVAPVIAAIVLPYMLAAPVFYLISLPIGFGYSVLLYIILLGEAERRLMNRESEIAYQINPSD